MKIDKCWLFLTVFAVPGSRGYTQYPNHNHNHNSGGPNNNHNHNHNDIRKTINNNNHYNNNFKYPEWNHQNPYHNNNPLSSAWSSSSTTTTTTTSSSSSYQYDVVPDESTTTTGWGSFADRRRHPFGTTTTTTTRPSTSRTTTTTASTTMHPDEFQGYFGGMRNDPTTTTTYYNPNTNGDYTSTYGNGFGGTTTPMDRFQSHIPDEDHDTIWLAMQLNIPDAKIQQYYRQWLTTYDKVYDESRYLVFKKNFLIREELYRLEHNGNSSNRCLLNEYGDCTQEEYKWIQKQKEFHETIVMEPEWERVIPKNTKDTNDDDDDDEADCVHYIPDLMP